MRSAWTNFKKSLQTETAMGLCLIFGTLAFVGSAIDAWITHGPVIIFGLGIVMVFFLGELDLWVFLGSLFVLFGVAGLCVEFFSFMTSPFFGHLLGFSLAAVLLSMAMYSFISRYPDKIPKHKSTASA